MSQVLGIIGCGKMAYAVIKGLTANKSITIDQIYINDINIERTNLFAQEFEAKSTSSRDLIIKSDIILLAVKPYQVRDILVSNRDCWDISKVIISVAAGIKTSDIEKECQIKLPVIRVMPNTPCLIGDGVAAISGGEFASQEHISLVQEMFNTLGASLLIEEKYMDAVTAVSGSGPAYAYLVAEAMINAAIQVGLDAATARTLVLNTLRGSINMLEQTGEHPAVLREAVCSPGGTTIAAVRKLEEHGIRGAFFAAIENAYQRSLELGKK